MHPANWINIVEIANPAIPNAGIKNKPKIKIGFNIILKIIPTNIKFLKLFVSPCEFKIELNENCIKKIKLPKKIISVYFFANIILFSLFPINLRRS